MGSKGVAGKLRKLKVLIIEESPHWRLLYQEILKNEKLEMYLASNIHEGEILFAELWDHLKSLDAVVASGGAGQEACENCAFVQSMRIMGYAGPIIAASGDPDVCDALKQAGCDYSVDGEKRKVPGLVEQVLKIA